jgi:hypothetical protein
VTSVALCPVSVGRYTDHGIFGLDNRRSKRTPGLVLGVSASLQVFARVDVDRYRGSAPDPATTSESWEGERAGLTSRRARWEPDRPTSSKAGKMPCRRQTAPAD